MDACATKVDWIGVSGALDMYFKYIGVWKCRIMFVMSSSWHLPGGPKKVPNLMLVFITINKPRQRAQNSEKRAKQLA